MDKTPTKKSNVRGGILRTFYVTFHEIAPQNFSVLRWPLYLICALQHDNDLVGMNVRPFQESSPICSPSLQSNSIFLAVHSSIM